MEVWPSDYVLVSINVVSTYTRPDHYCCGWASAGK